MRVFLFACALLLAGCSTGPQPRFSWGLGEAQGPEGGPLYELASLTYGVPETDWLEYRFSCKPSGVELLAWTGDLPVDIPYRASVPTSLSLILGRLEIGLPAALVKYDDGNYVVEVALLDPAAILQRLRTVPRLRTSTMNVRSWAPAPPPALIDQFEQACAAGQNPAPKAP